MIYAENDFYYDFNDKDLTYYVLRIKAKSFSIEVNWLLMALPDPVYNYHKITSWCFLIIFYSWINDPEIVCVSIDR